MSEVETRRQRVERETVLDAPPEEVWESLTDDERLGEWLAEEAELEPFEGGEVTVREADGGERHGTVETVIEPERLTFTWARPGEEPSRVEFEIEAVPGGSRLKVIETAPAGPSAFAGLAWGARFGELRRRLDLAPVA